MATLCSFPDLIDEFPLESQHFLTPAANSVFRALQSLHDKGQQIDLFTVQAEMGPHEVEQIGLHRMTDFCCYPTRHTAATFYETLLDKAALRRAYLAGDWMKRESMECRDAAQFCEEAARRVCELRTEQISENILPEAVGQALARLDRMDRGEKPRVLLTHVAAWDKVFGGIGDGRFYALASRPGLGKTAMMEQIITAYLMRDEAVAVFEKDMSPQMLVERIACREAKVPFWRYDREILEEHERKKVRLGLSYLDPNRLLLFNPNGLTAERMCSIVRRQIRAKGIRAVFLDHIQVLRFPGRDLREGLTQSSLIIRNNVTETGVPHIVLAHINRDGAKGRPQPENIKEFDQLFGDVDALGLLWSEVEAADVKGDERPMKLYAAKNRGGAVVEEDCKFNGPILKFV